MRAATFIVFLLSWAVVAAGSVWSALPARGGRFGEGWQRPGGGELAGTLLQWIGVLLASAGAGGPLRPSFVEMAGALVLGPAGAILFLAAVRAARGAGGPDTLLRAGVYGHLRHPMYLAFLLLLLSTGMIASAGWRLAAAVVVYLAGTEWRVVVEEASLAVRMPAHRDYRFHTRWRYLPGIR